MDLDKITETGTASMKVERSTQDSPTTSCEEANHKEKQPNKSADSINVNSNTLLMKSKEKNNVPDRESNNASFTVGVVEQSPSFVSTAPDKKKEQRQQQQLLPTSQFLISVYANSRDHLQKGNVRKKCEICKVTFKRDLTFELHKRWHTIERPYTCDICLTKFTRVSALESHKRWHELDRPFECDQCHATFAQGWTLKMHLQKHREHGFQCTTCWNKFPEKLELEAHERRHVELPYECDVCAACFSVRLFLKLHMRMHTQNRPWQCNNCRAIFIERTSLDAHKEERHPDIFDGS